MDTPSPQTRRIACLTALLIHRELVRDRLWTAAQLLCAVSLGADLMWHGSAGVAGLWIVTVCLVVMAWRASGRATETYRQRIDAMSADVDAVN